MVGRPETHPIKKIIRFNEAMVEMIEKWRRKQKPKPNFTEAVRQLIEMSLETTPKEGSKHGR
jgi:hypothetical protein